MKAFFLPLLIVTINCISQNSPAPIKFIDILLTPNHADWNYLTDQEAEVEITVLQYGGASERA